MTLQQRILSQILNELADNANGSGAKNHLGSRLSRRKSVEPFTSWVKRVGLEGVLFDRLWRKNKKAFWSYSQESGFAAVIPQEKSEIAVQ